MAIELTPEQEQQVQERLFEKEKELREQFDGHLSKEMLWLLDMMKEHFGKEALQVYLKATGEKKRAQWKKIAEDIGDDSIEALIVQCWGPSLEEARKYGFEYTKEEAADGIQIRCTKCPIYETAERNGTMEYLLMNCKLESFMVEGFNPNIGFSLTKMLSQGDDHCNHFYFYKDKSK